jgi:hypothetical protein
LLLLLWRRWHLCWRRGLLVLLLLLHRRPTKGS